MMHGSGSFGDGGWFGAGFFGNGWTWLIGIGIVLVVIAATYLIASSSRRRTSDYDALEILKTKFAQGEISEEEYNRRKSIIGR